MTITNNNLKLNLKQTVKIREFQNHAHLLFLQAPTIRSKAKAPTVVLKTSVLSSLSKESKVSTITILIR
jgi:hypothetical protein